ncbi:DNA invertase Pin-like site-specific DNA recombinase [Ancylobacter aquaticus]|uniref:DNA invertase Pin-like site-specific DNA recombinase n=1 Tax=Ancylobacter aquaticus TaxID=100 RepID=A0A4R1HSH2_ANCAQ|nr:recombinase family protein [Ancylobacter aquaticus]TCK23520.1 DNA invertase Pin-like site-specific DNA recombinase [Ancylobacter aquaticus]
MVINWNNGNDQIPSAEPLGIPAAEYVRMSTEHQQYSTDNQTLAVRLYAEQRGFRIVRTYADEGRSGLTVGGRPALKQLLYDIEHGQADFRALLVYDVSRLGRWQDTDEAASHELRCRRAGIAVHYCAEQFENDGSIGSSIIKTVKRAMAGEYSRELSVKGFAGQANLIRLGYRQGGAAGFGLRRLLVDQHGEAKTELKHGQQKSIATDRVILVLGPPAEVKFVQQVYRLFVDGQSEQQIADFLNGQGVLSDLGRPWTRGTVHQLLTNEKYIGNNVWARTSFKLKDRHVSNKPEDWIRADNAFPRVVDPETFDKAQAIIASRAQHLSDEAMLEILRSILERNGMLSGLIIDEMEGAPSSSSYRCRFGGLIRAYALAGFSPARDYRYLEINRKLRSLHPALVDEVLAGLRLAGGIVIRNPLTDILTINEEFTASIIIVRCLRTSAGSLRWKLRLDTALKPDLTVAVRMDENNMVPRDYYLLPRLDMRTAVLRLSEHNGLSLDAYRFDTPDTFYGMAARQPFPRAA